MSMPLLINWKRISVYQALFLCAGYQARGWDLTSLIIGICYFHNAWCPPRDLIFMLNYITRTLELRELDGGYHEAFETQKSVFTRLEDNTDNMCWGCLDNMKFD